MSQNTTSFEPQISSTRTVYDILWSCLFAIFACTWTVQHLNIPEQRDEKDPGWRGDIKWGLKNTLTSAKWMCYTILAPEALVSLSVGSLLSVYQNLEFLKTFAEEDNDPWTLTHSLFADMGGFVIRSYTPERGENRGLSFQNQELKDSTQVTERVQQNTMMLPQDSHLEEPQSTDIIYLVADEIKALRESNAIKLPFITKEEIMDKGKSDGFARSIAIGQMLWMVVQMIVRASRHLEISQLEIGTVAFASCAIIIYILNWNKPKGVGVPLTLLSYPSAFPDEIIQALGPPLPNNSALNFFKSESDGRGLKQLACRDRYSPVPNHHLYTSVDNKHWDSRCLFIISGLFGGIHFAALNSTFPSDIERMMWCVASAVCTGIFFLFILAFFLLVLSLQSATTCFMFDPDFVLYVVWKLNAYSILALYIIARLFLIMELFRCLFFLSPSALVATWASSIPHVS